MRNLDDGGTADIVTFSGAPVKMDPDRPKAEAMALQGGDILDVGST